MFSLARRWALPWLPGLRPTRAQQSIAQAGQLCWEQLQLASQLVVQERDNSESSSPASQVYYAALPKQQWPGPATTIHA
eukprot:362159-Chlamydomonas_euryale.AAC.8